MEPPHRYEMRKETITPFIRDLSHSLEAYPVLSGDNDTLATPFRGRPNNC